mgnify:CR=1 FL=1
MKVTIKSAEEIEKMRRAGEILAAVHQNLAREIKPGMSTLDIDRLGEEMIRGYECIPSFKILRISGVYLCFGKRRSGAWDSDRRKDHQRRRYCQSGCRSYL